jgi:hypothetical protein
MPHCSVDDDDADSGDAFADPTGSDGDARAILDDVFATLRVRAAGQRDEALVLACWEQGVVDRAEIASTTGLSPGRYAAAQRRLRRWSRTRGAGSVVGRNKWLQGSSDCAMEMPRVSA